MENGHELWRRVDAGIVAAAKHIKMLSSLTWSVDQQSTFLDAFDRGQPRLPEPDPVEIDLASERAELQRLAEQAGTGHPIADYLKKTAESYIVATHMLESCGTPAFVELGRQLFGGPETRIASRATTVLAAAEHFLRETEALAGGCRHREEDYCIAARTVADAIRAEADSTFGEDRIAVVLDASLPSKAAAGANRIRIREATCFSAEDIDQLVQHELLVHTLTAINGRSQPHLASLGLGAPRTTATQEGLAVFAEIVTGSMDLDRLRRIALRPKGLQLVLDGADFVEVFRFFVEAGQTRQESYQSTYRLFRGGDVRGGIAFMKDGVYLLGLLAVHSFLRKAIEGRRPELVTRLFAGRLTLGDSLALEPGFDDGSIAIPTTLPKWAANPARLASFLTHADFVHGLDLSGLALPDLAQAVESLEP